MAEFRYQGYRIDYSEFGAGDRVVVLVHGQLLSQRMEHPLARALAERGFRVVTPDLLGHGRSDRPDRPWPYSMTQWGEQVVALLDHLGVASAAVGGTSLGANVTLEVAALAPDRVTAMVVEMPVLEHALFAGLVAFAPLMSLMTFAAPVAGAVTWLARRVPEGTLPFWLDVGLDMLRQEPGPAAAVMQGIFFGRIAPPRGVRSRIQTPALVIGHRNDPIHPFADAGMLADELPNGRLVQARSVLEMRFFPGRLTDEIARFLDGCWQEQSATG